MVIKANIENITFDENISSTPKIKTHNEPKLEPEPQTPTLSNSNFIDANSIKKEEEKIVTYLGNPLPLLLIMHLRLLRIARVSLQSQDGIFFNASSTIFSPSSTPTNPNPPNNIPPPSQVPEKQTENITASAESNINTATTIPNTKNSQTTNPTEEKSLTIEVEKETSDP